MAGCASARTAAGLGLLHSLVELPPMRIGVATGAVEVLPMEDRRWRLQFRRLLVTIGARHGDMFAGQLKPGLLVLRKREGRRFVTVDRMAAFAGVEVRCASKLAGVLVSMTVGAMLEFQLEDSVDAAWDMALVAAHLHVRTGQGICGLRVIRHREGRRFPSFHRMTGRALAAIRPGCELTLMRIRLVAVHAFLEGNRLLEVAASVALNATHRRVFAEQREFRFGVVEA